MFGLSFIISKYFWMGFSTLGTNVFSIAVPVKKGDGLDLGGLTLMLDDVEKQASKGLYGNLLLALSDSTCPLHQFTAA
jgi:hypothetical protein